MTSEEFYKKEKVVESYDKIRFSGKKGRYINKRELSVVLDFLKNEKSKRIIEVGPGTGRLSKLLIKKSHSLTLLDNSDEMLKILKRKLRDGNINFVKGNAKNLNLDRKFDCYVSLRVFIHFNDLELDTALKQAKKVLKKGGYLIFDTLNSRSLYPIIKPISLFKYRFPYNHFINEEKMREIIKKNGFDVVEIKGIFVIPKFMIRYSPIFWHSITKLNKILERRFPEFSTHVFWKIKKI